MAKDLFKDWKEREAMAESMIPLIGKLYRDHNVVTSVYGRSVINRSVIEIIKAHKFVQKILSDELSVRETYPILEILSKLNLAPSRIDLGKLVTGYHACKMSTSLEEYVRGEVAPIIDGKDEHHRRGQDVVLYGFGRIGRLMARLLIERAGGGESINLRAIVVRKGGAKNDLQKRASLLRRDSVHGSFRGSIDIDEENNLIYANGVKIQVIYSNAPDQVDYTQYGINNAIIIDNTGIWRDEEGLGQHLQCPGASRVLLTAPGKGDIKNV